MKKLLFLGICSLACSVYAEPRLQCSDFKTQAAAQKFYNQLKKSGETGWKSQVKPVGKAWIVMVMGVHVIVSRVGMAKIARSQKTKNYLSASSSNWVVKPLFE